MYSKTLTPEIMQTMLPAGFPADKLSQPQYKMVVEKDVMIPMRDGVMIAANIYRPDAPGTFPALHAADSYQKDMVNIVPTLPIFHCVEVNDIEYFVSRGYVFVHTDSRGTGHSLQGEWAFWSQEEQTDLYDMIEWIAAQDWCSGKVGMLGESLLAWVQWFAACQQPPHLACILPWDAGADMYRDVAWHGGMMSVGFPTAWHMWEIRGHYRLGIPARFGTEPTNPEWGRWDLVWNVINHPTYDDFWKLRNPDFSKIQVPVFTVGALHKVGLHLRGVVRGYEEVQTPKKMMLIHGEMDGDEMAIYNTPEMRMLMLRWYDHWLKGNDTGMMDEPPVSIFVRGADEYRWRTTGQSRAPSTASSTSTPGRAAPSWSRSTTARCPGSRRPRPRARSPTRIRTRIGPTSPAAARRPSSTASCTSRAASRRSSASRWKRTSRSRATSCSCSTPRATRRTPTSSAGWWTSCPTGAGAGHAPQGLHPHAGLAEGLACGDQERGAEPPDRPYYLHDEPKHIEPDKVYGSRSRCGPRATCFKKGHRIRIDVACGDSPAVDFGGHYYGVKVGSDTYYHEVEHPSHIVLPVIPAP